MFAKLTRAALAGCLTLIAVDVSAETVDASNQSAPRIEYRYLGQGAYSIVLVPRTESTYALTGRTPDREYWNRQAGQFISTGQGRYFIPATR